MSAALVVRSRTIHWASPWDSSILPRLSNTTKSRWLAQRIFRLIAFAGFSFHASLSQGSTLEPSSPFDRIKRNLTISERKCG